MRKQAGAVQLVDGVSQLVADVKHWIFTSSQHCNVIDRIRETAVADGCNLGVSADLLRSQVTSRAASPSSSTVHDFLGGNHGVELRDLDAGAAFAGIQDGVAHDCAALCEQRTLFDCLRHIGREVIPFYDVREQDTAGIILKWGGHG